MSDVVVIYTLTQYSLIIFSLYICLYLVATKLQLPHRKNKSLNIKINY